MSERAPTPEQAAAIAVGGRDVLLEAGAGTGKTGVMVDRYCRLVCDEGVSPDAILAFTFTDKAAAELRQRIRIELARRAELGSERAGELLSGIGGAWVTTIHGFCNRLLAAHPVAAGIDPGFRVLDAPESARAAREAFDEALPEFLAGAPDSGDSGPLSAHERESREERSPPSTSTGCGGSSPASTPSCAVAARRGRSLPEPPPADPAAAIQRRRRGRRRVPRGAEGDRLQTRAARAGAGEAQSRQGRTLGLDELRALRPSSKAKAILPYREAIEAAISALCRGRRGWRGLPPPGDPAGALLDPLRGGQGAPRRDRLRGPADPRRAAAGAGRDRRVLPQPLQPPAGRRVPGHQPPAAAADRGAAGPAQRAGRRRRRVPVDLRLPPRRPRRLPPAARRRSSGAPMPS